MTIDMTVALLDENDKPIIDQTGIRRVEDLAGAPVLTLGRACMHALFATFPDEGELSIEEKWSRGLLAMKVRDDPLADLTSDQIVKIKQRVGKLYGGRVIMQAFPLIDPTAKPPELT